MKKGFARNLLVDYSFEKIISISPAFFAGADLIIFDVDNTLVISETTKTKKDVVDWFKEVNSKYRCICLSNSRTILRREKQITELLDCEVFLNRHKKPSKALFKELKEKYNLNGKKIFIIGDRVFPDILFGNINGMTTVLVKPLSNSEGVLVKVARVLENFVLFFVKLIYT